MLCVCAHGYRCLLTWEAPGLLELELQVVVSKLCDQVAGNQSQILLRQVRSTDASSCLSLYALWFGAVWVYKGNYVIINKPSWFLQRKYAEWRQLNSSYRRHLGRVVLLSAARRFQGKIKGCTYTTLDKGQSGTGKNDVRLLPVLTLHTVFQHYSVPCRLCSIRLGAGRSHQHHCNYGTIRYIVLNYLLWRLVLNPFFL